MVTLRLNLYERLLANSTHDPATDCIVWRKSCNANGYGQISVNNKMRRVQIVAYELFAGRIEVGLVLDRLCRNRACLNPKPSGPCHPRREQSAGCRLHGCSRT